MQLWGNKWIWWMAFFILSLVLGHAGFKRVLPDRMGRRQTWRAPPPNKYLGKNILVIRSMIE